MCGWPVVMCGWPVSLWRKPNSALRQGRSDPLAARQRCWRQFVSNWASQRQGLLLCRPPPMLMACGRGGIGRRAALRSLWGNPWKFESSRPHHFPDIFSKMKIDPVDRFKGKFRLFVLIARSGCASAMDRAKGCSHSASTRPSRRFQINTV